MAARQKKEKASLKGLIEQVQPPVVPQDGVGVLPTMEPHEILDLNLRQAVQRSSASMMQVAEHAYHAVEAQVYTKFGFADEVDYFNDRVRLSYRSARRLITVYTSVLGIEESARPTAIAEFCNIGIHKAAVIAPAVTKDPSAWQRWVDAAQGISESALQEKVSDAVNAKTRGLRDTGGQPGDRFLKFILNAMPDDDLKEEVREVFEAGTILAESKNPVAVFIALVRHAKTDWVPAAARVRRGGSNA